MRISRQASLKKFNTFNVTENADVIYEVEDVSMLKNIVSDNNQILILGGGAIYSLQKVIMERLLI